MHLHAKLCQNRSIGCEDIKIFSIFQDGGRRHVAIFRIFRMATAAILDFQNCEVLLSIGVQRVEKHQHAKFCQNRSIGCEDFNIFRFSRWRPPPSWIVEFTKFYWLTVSARPRCITVPNFVKIGRSIAEILLFFEFSRWPPPPSWIFEIAKFYRLLRSRGWKHISMPNFVRIDQSVTKLIRFIDFSIWRPSAILDWFGAYLDHPQWALGGLYCSAKFGFDRCSSFYNMNISIFGTFGWKILSHTPKIGVFGQFDPINGIQYQPKPKRHTLAWVRVIWAIKSENMVSGLTCRCIA